MINMSLENERENLRRVANNLVAGLFYLNRNTPSLEGGSRKNIREFSGRDEVYGVTADYLDQLIKIWKSIYPDEDLHIFDHSDSDGTNETEEATDVSGLPAPEMEEAKESGFQHAPIWESPATVQDEQKSEDAIMSPDNKKGDTSTVVTKDLALEIKEQESGENNLAAGEEITVVAEEQKVEEKNSSIDSEETGGAVQDTVESNDTVKDAQADSGEAVDHPADSGAGNFPETLRQKEQAVKKPAPVRENRPTNVFDVSFQLPNAKIGETYGEKVSGRDLNNNEVKVLDLKIPEGFGLSFNCESQELSGTPLVAGEHKFALQWSDQRGPARYTGECLLIVNPDAKSLWKNIEPPADDPYFKPNTGSKLIKADQFTIAAASCRGRSHAHVGSFRDDDFFIEHDAESGWSILIVADGAGGSKSSRWGSKLAVEAVGKHLTGNLFGEPGNSLSTMLTGWNSDIINVSKEVGTKFYYLFHEASSSAIKAIAAEAAGKGSAAKDYSSTLLAAAIRRVGDSMFISTYWMGDGAIAVYGPKGKVRLMGTPDSGEYAGQTRFLDRKAIADADFAKRIQLGMFTGITSVILMTDGISDPRFETDNGLLDPEKWDSLWEEISPYLTGDTPESNLLGWLDFLTPGHHDDRTIALYW